jgi:hypothetical protein
MTGESSRRLIPCIMPGSCYDSFGQTRTACPRPTAGDPLDVAENLCPVALEQRFGTATRVAAAAVLRAAWGAVETGLAYGSVRPDEAGSAFSEAERILSPLLTTDRKGTEQSKPLTPALRLGAHALYAFMPAFRARTQPDNIFGERDCDKLYMNLVDGMKMLGRNERIRANGHLAEVEFTALTARAGRVDRLAYPASPREEQQSDAHKRWNHDVYALGSKRHGKLEKRPIQIKFSDASMNSVPPEDREFYLIYRLDILQPAGVPTGKTLIEYFIAELDGSIARNDLIVLNRATNLALAFIEKRLRSRHRTKSMKQTQGLTVR